MRDAGPSSASRVFVIYKAPVGLTSLPAILRHLANSSPARCRCCFRHPNEELYALMDYLGPESGWTGRFPTTFQQRKANRRLIADATATADGTGTRASAGDSGTGLIAAVAGDGSSKVDRSGSP